MMRSLSSSASPTRRVRAIVIDPLVSNERAHKFYRRLGFKPIGRRVFGDDSCLVHELQRRHWQSAAAHNASG